MEETEPVRLRGWTALVIGLGLNGVLAWGLGLDLRSSVVLITTMALTSIGGLEFARRGAYSPRKVGVEVSRARRDMYDSLIGRENEDEGV